MSARRGLRQVVTGPEFTTDVVQIIKAVLAATAAWWFAVAVLQSDLPFLAPWTALLTVHATVHRSFSRGVQTTLASAVGVALSFLIGHYLGVGLWTFALALFVGVALARVRWIRDEGLAIATTAIFVLSSGFTEQAPFLDDRLLEVGVGVGTGIVVNLLIIPPLRDRQAARYIDSLNERMGGLLQEMGEEFSDSWETERAESWFEATDSMRAQLDSAWTVVRFARESRRGNPRGFVRATRGSRALGQRRWQAQHASYEEILERSDEGISHLRNLARTLREAAYAQGAWDEKFREEWVAIVQDVGRAIADPDSEVEPLHDRLIALSARMSEGDELPPDFWPTYGALITSVRHIVVIVDDVASARAAREASSSARS